MTANFYKLTFLLCITSVTISSCNFSTDQEAEKLVKAQTAVEEATLDLGMARKDSSEFAQYKIESEKQLRGNELLIADMKDKMNSERKVSMANYEKQLDSLELQNSRLRNDMRMFNSESKAKWESFKKNFNKELDSLRKSISLLVERNVKKGS
jgi:hypothetical protein